MKFKAKTKDYQLVVRAKTSFGEQLFEQEITLAAQKNIRGFMKPKIVKKGVVDYVGPVSISMADRLKKPISSYDFFFVLQQIVDIVRKAQKNNLVISRMLLDINYVYINETTKELQFIYLPMADGEKKSDITQFIYSIIYSAIPQSPADSAEISRFTYFAKSLPGYNGDKIEKYIAGVEPGIVRLLNNAETSQSGFITNKQKEYYEHYDEKPDVREDRPDERNIRHDDGLGVRRIVEEPPRRETRFRDVEEDEGTIQLGQSSYYSEDEGTMPLIDDYDETAPLIEDDDDCATELLTDSRITYEVHYPELCRLSTGERVKVNKPVYRIGKEKSYVDFFIANNTKISRSHLDIIRRGERYFVKDLGSKNKTYINNRVIMPQQETEIFDGDILRLADEEFTFNI